jgi:hypothetical protein
MSSSFQPFFPQALQSISVANAAVTTTSNVVQGGANNGTKIETITITSTDTIDHSLLFSLNVAGVLTAIANVNIPANSGNGVVASVNLFANNYFSYLPQDVNGNKYMYIANASCSLVCSSNSANGAGKVVAVSGQAAVF